MNTSMILAVFVHTLLTLCFGVVSEDLNDRYDCVSSVNGTSINISDVDLLQLTRSRSFLHCSSLCHVVDGCRGVAHAEGECWLINGTAAGYRLFQGNCSTCQYRFVWPKQIHDGKDCKALLDKGHCMDGVYSIQPDAPFQAFCDMTNGGWTVIQRRVDDSVDFYRGWADYVAGFGDATGNFWAGLDNIHALTSCGSAELLVTMETFEGESAEAHYSSFHVGDAESGYLLSVGGYSGTAGDSMALHNLQKFSTYDKDNDVYKFGNCANLYTGAWWYYKCHTSNPNGQYLHGVTDSYGGGVIWEQFKGFYYSLKTMEFKVRCL